MNSSSKKHLFKYFAIFASIIFSYLIIFFYFFFYLEKDFKDNFKNKSTLAFYKKYSPFVNHLRYKEVYRSKLIEQELLFNFIKDTASDKVILFQGDSWIEQINEITSNKQYLLDNLKSFTKIINGGVASYSPSLINAQYKILEQDFKIRPDILVIYIDQTDMGDELCRYKNLINLNNKGRIASVKMETFPLYTEVFNLHEKISFSDIDINSSNKIVKTQKYINYKILKSFFKIKKKFQSKFNKNIYYQKCHWPIIEGYKKDINKEEIEYFETTLNRLFNFLSEKKYIKKIFIVTHPHKSQLEKNNKLINVSNFVDKTLKNFKKIEHINFSDILKKDRNFYGDIELIWKKNDDIHLNNKSFKIFLRKITETIEKFNI